MYEQVFRYHAKLLKALAHPRRLEIIHLLRERELTVSQIFTMLDLPQANISQHLQILRQAHVVSTTRKGKLIFYTLSHKNFIKASDLIREVIIKQNHGNSVPLELKEKMLDMMPLATDPVCLMRVSPKTAAFSLENNGKRYYFCASGCLKKFTQNPQKYVK